MSRTLDASWPGWLRDIDALLAVHPQFVLSGNVRDRYPLPDPDMPLADSAPQAIHTALSRSGFDVVLVHDVVDGFSLLADDDDDDAGWAAVHAATGQDLRDAPGDDLSLLSTVLRAIASGDGRTMALVLDYASRLAINPASLAPREHHFFSSCLKAAHEAAPLAASAAGRAGLYNSIFWIVEREHDLPAWFTAGNRAVRSIPIPWPSLEDRAAVSRRLVVSAAESHREAAAAEVAGGTEGLELASLFDIATLLRDQAISHADADDAVRIYKLGAGDSPWRQGAVADRLRSLGEHGVTGILEGRVLGQPHAVTKAVDILKRSVLGLSGAQASRFSAKPRGVLFFAGPTGTGKTELAKAITELVFGSDDAYIRFDMSEFSAEHAGDRLVGAPPGYVGFEGGGELTNAVRRRPYSLLLFDEVEKAHPRILDKFLQLLDDGRLTDGRGTTVHFSETIIVFTSNLGMSVPAGDGTGRRVPNVDAGDSYPDIELRVRSEIHRFFTEELNRPELLNRVGDNVVVFDFIREDVASRIVALQLQNIVERVKGEIGIDVQISAEAAEQIRAAAVADLSFGGRGIGNVLESRFINPLARALFDRGAAQGDAVEVVNLVDAAVPEVELR